MTALTMTMLTKKFAGAAGLGRARPALLGCATADAYSQAVQPDPADETSARALRLSAARTVRPMVCPLARDVNALPPSRRCRLTILLAGMQGKSILGRDERR